MPTDDERPEDGDQRQSERPPESRERTRRPARPADPFPAPMTPSRN
jgi:hypothetical protein